MRKAAEEANVKKTNNTFCTSLNVDIFEQNGFMYQAYDSLLAFRRSR